MKVKYVQEIAKEKQDPVFYGGRILEISYRGGKIIVNSEGSIRLNVHNKESEELIETIVRTESIICLEDELEEYGIDSDEKLEKMIRGDHDKYRVSFGNNPWWEIGFVTDGEYYDLSWASGEHKIDSVIEEIEENLDVFDNLIEAEGLV